jgi:hypothetical protein
MSENKDNTVATPAEVKPTEAAATPVQLHEIIAAGYPEEKITTPEQAAEKLKSLIETSKKDGEFKDIMSDAFHAEPRLADVIRDHATGKRKTIMSAIGAHFDPEELVPGDGEQGAEDMKAAVGERKAKVEGMKKRSEELNKNLSESRKNLENFKKEKGLSDEDHKAFVDHINDMHQALYDGKLTPEHIAKLHEGFTAQAKIAEAHEDGKNEGLNTKIKERKITTEKPVLPNIVAASESGSPVPAKEKDGKDVDWREVAKQKEISKKK